MTADSRPIIREAARELFARRSFAETTVRDIALEAGVSPALVIKHFRSKGELYLEVGPSAERLADLDLPREAIGRALVQQIFERRSRGASEPWIDNLVAIRESPDPDATRVAVRERLVSYTARLIGDTSVSLDNAQAVVAGVVGIAHSVRDLGLFSDDDTLGSDRAISLLAASVQALIDKA